jgi:hypothetical protein
MSGYPMTWEAATSMDRLVETCPYSIEEMQEHLFVNHYQRSRDEQPTTFVVSCPCAQKAKAERRCWLFEATKDRSARRERKGVWCRLCQRRHVLEPLHAYRANNSTNQGRQWFVVVGAGNGCFDPSSKLRRWIYAETNDEDLLPEQFLEEAYHEQFVADARS